MSRRTPASPLESHQRGGREDATLLPSALSRIPGHLLWRAAARVDLALERLLPENVDIHAWAVLVVLGEGAPRSQQTLADQTSVSRTTIARIADELASSGLVDRHRNPEDRRSYVLARTPGGAEAAEHWRADVEAVESALTAEFSATDRRDLHRLLLRLADEYLADVTPEVLRASTGFLVTRIHLHLHRHFAETLRPWGVMPRDFGSLTLLREAPVAQGELARLLGVSGATAVQIVDDLEAAGLVQRRRDPHDRRTQQLHLLPRGREVWQAVKGHTDPEAGFGPLDRARTDRLVTLLARFVTAPLPDVSRG